MKVRSVPSDGHVVVVGAGLMGSGIAQVVALSGRNVSVVEVTEQAADQGRRRIDESFDRLVRGGRLEDDLAASAKRKVTLVAGLESVVASADMVIESVIEDLDVKQSLFETLDRTCDADIVLATNTSQFQIGRIASRCEHRARVLGMHWSNPPVLMKLVELVVSDETSDEALEVASVFVESCERQLVVCRKDVPGFISNRLSNVLFMEGARLVDEGVATAAEVDAVARLMFGHRMGPLETLDLAGLDTALHVATALDAHYGGTRFTPPPILGALVGQGRLGRKSGAGFYDTAK